MYNIKKKYIIRFIMIILVIFINIITADTCNAEVQDPIPCFDSGYEIGEYFYQSLILHNQINKAEIILNKDDNINSIFKQVEQGRYTSKIELYGAAPYLNSMKDHKYTYTIINRDSVKYLRITYKVHYKYSKVHYQKYNKKLKYTVAKLKLYKLKNEKEQVTAIYDYICKNVYYRNKKELDSTPYSALYYGKANCKGFSELFFDMCQEAGIDCAIIYGNTSSKQKDTITHAWNIVKIGKTWYNVDSSWDTGRTKYKYFLKSDEYFEYLNHFRGKEQRQDSFVEKHLMCKPKGKWMRNLKNRLG